MNSHFFRSRELAFSVPWMCLWLAVFWAGSQGIENRFGLAGIPAVICVAYSQDFRNSENPLIIAAYIHAMSAWSWHPMISALFPTSHLFYNQIRGYCSFRANHPSWEVELISVIIFNLLLCLKVVVLAAGFEGIENGMGLTWAIVALAALMCRFSIGPFGIGACFQITSAWGWNPTMAVLFATGPTICFLIGCHINKTLFLGPLPFPNKIWRWR
jgi:hypothetical protein